MTRTLQKLLVLLTALLLLAPGAALAQEDDVDDEMDDDSDAEDVQDEQEDADDEDDDRDEDDEREDERKVEVTRTDQRAEFKLEKETDASEQEVKFSFEATEGDLKLEFERESNGTEEYLEYKVKLQRLVEYQDLNDDGLWQEDSEPSTASWDIEDLTWEIGPVDDITVDGRDGKELTATGHLPDSNGTFDVRMVAFGDYVSVNATDLTPTDVKIDFVYADIPWTTSTTRLALDLKVETEQEIEHDDGDDADDPGLNATFGDVSAYFTWADTAQVDGANTSVESQVLETESENESEDGEAESYVEKRILLNYEQGDEIVHDPVMGVAYSTQGVSETAATPLPGAVALLTVLGLAAVAHRRRNR